MKNLNSGGNKSGKIKITDDYLIKFGLEKLKEKIIISSDKERKLFDIVDIEYNEELDAIRIKVK